MMNAVLLKDVAHTERPKNDTVRLIKENVPIVRLNVGVENDKRKKTWMIGVQHLYPQGVIYHHRIHDLLLRFKIFMGQTGWMKRDVVIFVALAGQS